jgi:hypothetical protein
MAAGEPEDNAKAFLKQIDSIKPTDVSSVRTDAFTSEGDFNGLTVELLIEVGSFICVAGNLLPKTRRWDRNQAVLGGQLVRLYKLISALLDQICQHRHIVRDYSHNGRFDDFLFASIGPEGNGMPLSVNSALARLDLDPWQEATQLAELPGETATKRMASLIAALPDAASMHRDSGTIAARLTALLPRRGSSVVASRKSSLSDDAAAQFSAGTYWYIVLILIMLAAQWIVANHQTLAQVDDSHKLATSNVSSQATPPNVDR